MKEISREFKPIAFNIPISLTIDDTTLNIRFTITKTEIRQVSAPMPTIIIRAELKPDSTVR